MVAPGRFQIRSWVFLYLGLIAAMLLAGQPPDPKSSNAGAVPAPAVIVDSPLLRRDI